MKNDDDKTTENEEVDLDKLDLDKDSNKKEDSPLEEGDGVSSGDDSSSDESSSDSNNTSSETTTTASSETVVQEAPADALSRDPDDLAAEQALSAPVVNTKTKKKRFTKLRAILRKVNVYFLIFVLIFVIAGAISIVSYLNSQQEPEDPEVAIQEISQEALQQLSNSDVSIGDTSQTLTVQGNAVIDGQTLMRGNLSVAGNIQGGGSIQGGALTITGASNLGELQVNNLQVATDISIQGNTTMNDLTVAGPASFGGALTASQITVTDLILSGNSSLQIPNHISFTGASPSRTMNGAVLGGGGSTSIDGSDAAGTVNINTGTGTSSGCMTTITFNQAYDSQPHVIITPIGATAGNLNFYVDRSQSGFSICTTNAPAANQSFAFDYFVMS